MCLDVEKLPNDFVITWRGNICYFHWWLIKMFYFLNYFIPKMCQCETKAAGCVDIVI